MSDELLSVSSLTIESGVGLTRLMCGELGALGRVAILRGWSLVRVLLLIPEWTLEGGENNSSCGATTLGKRGTLMHVRVCVCVCVCVCV